MRTILLAWELGAGFGHVTALGRLAAKFAPHGFRLIAIVNNVTSASVLAAQGVEVLQAPGWPSALQSDPRKSLSSATLGDTLGDLGFADEEALRSLIGAWDRLFTRIAPDLVVCDYAPAAALAARGRIPLALTGSGFTLPPAEMEKFPLLHAMARPVWPEERLLETVNAALRAFDRQQLERLPQLFAGDLHWVRTFPLLDAYNLWRERPPQGPLIDRLPDARRADAREILVYISGHLGRHPQILHALRMVAERVRIFAPGVPGGELERLAGFGMRIERAPFRLPDELASARLVIHHGSAGISAEALIAGVPQLLLSIHIEHDLAGAALESAGVGKLIKLHDPAASRTADMIASVLNDGTMAEQAKKVGDFHRLMFEHADPLSEFDVGCRSLIA
jgi:UDP:flavonoid glycosyltransferase YjiC (YdhE family)